MTSAGTCRPSRDPLPHYGNPRAVRPAQRSRGRPTSALSAAYCERSEASARRSVSRVLSRRASRRARGWPSICGRRSPDGSCGRPEGWAAHLSPVDGRPPAGCALLFGLAPGGVCRVSLRSTGSRRGRHRHCGTGPRLTAGGRYPPPCAAELGLSSRRAGSPPPVARPSDRLADRPILHPRSASASRRAPVASTPERAPHDRRRAARLRAIDRLVGQRVGSVILGPRDVGRRPAIEAGQRRRGRRPERDQLRRP